MRKFRLKFGIDVDDVLFSCNEYALQLANKEHKFDPPLTLDEVETWGKTGGRIDKRLDYYEKEEFFRTQPVLKGAREFIRTLLQYGEVYFITAVEPKFMSIRAERLLSEFPEIPKENLIMGSMKNLVKVDILLDDGAHNIIASESAYPVLMRRPWNHHMTGCLSVNNYEEFLTLVETISSTYQKKEPVSSKEHRVFALVGPSASGKTELIKAMTMEKLAVQVPSYTTRERRKGEAANAYHFVSKEKFQELEQKGAFFETTRYAGQCYGSSIQDITATLKKNNVVMAMDICGAIALKRAFNEKVVLVYLDRPKEDLILAILQRDCSEIEKMKRIISLNDERKNEALCDVVIRNDGSISELLEKFKQETNLRRI